jgi:DNA repair exonuclease SbcCD nuclease subunit
MEKVNMNAFTKDQLDSYASQRRDLLKLAAVGGGVVMSTALPGCASMGVPALAGQNFSFVQLSDIHWGYNNASVNPDFKGTLPRAIAAVNSLENKPDFVVFTGDLTQSTDNASLRRDRLKEFRDFASELKVPVRFFAGEHDASLDRGEAYQQFFGNTLRYTFDHKGLHFIVLDNTSDPAPILGDAQLDWLKADLAKLTKEQPIVVLTHRPLFALYPQWDWATRDGEQAISLLMPFKNVTVFYGHIHHEHHHMTGHIAHHSANSTMFPLAPVGTMDKKTQLPWNPAKPYAGLGWQNINSSSQGFKLWPHGVQKT